MSKSGKDFLEEAKKPYLVEQDNIPTFDLMKGFLSISENVVNGTEGNSTLYM